MNQPAQQQDVPGVQSEMTPRPDCGEESYRGSGRLEGKSAVITGGDSGIGRAIAIAFAREGADVLISYLDEDEDAKDTARLVEEAGRKAVLVGGDLSKAQHCRELIAKAVSEFGKVGGSIIGSSSVNSDMPSPSLAPYAATKAAIANFTASLAQMLGSKGIRANSVAPGPVWTPLIPATMPPEKVESFGKDVPLGRPAQPAELAPVYVLLASDEGSYISGARITVTGGNPIL